jgi:methylated-DNA-[protein]-cysteine S-methyltransferase
MRREEQQYCLFDTALGVCGIVWSADGLTRLRLPAPDATRMHEELAQEARRASAKPTMIDALIADVCRYMAGGRTDFSTAVIDIDRAPAFDQDVYRAARRIAWGQTLTYGEIARRVDAPDAARAVGRAFARNPLPLIVPCHRVLASKGKIGGFSAPGGISTKVRLLALEGVSLSDTRQADLFADVGVAGHIQR